MRTEQICINLGEMEGQFVTRKCARRELVCIDNTVMEYGEARNKAETNEKRLLITGEQIINKTNGKKMQQSINSIGDIKMHFG